MEKFFSSSKVESMLRGETSSGDVSEAGVINEQKRYEHKDRQRINKQYAANHFSQLVKAAIVDERHSALFLQSNEIINGRL